MSKGDGTPETRIEPLSVPVHAEPEVYATGSASTEIGTLGTIHTRSAGRAGTGTYTYGAVARQHAHPAPVETAEPASEPEELRRIPGVVVGHAGSSIVRVELSDADLTVDFPSELFSGTGLAKLGQPVDYVVRQRADGIRFQSFEGREAAAENPEIDRIRDLLSVFDD